MGLLSDYFTAIENDRNLRIAAYEWAKHISILCISFAPVIEALL